MIDLPTQEEADDLFNLVKELEDENKLYRFPYTGGKLEVPLQSIDKSTKFSLDIHTNSLNLTKCTYQKRVYTSIVLARLDINGPRHRNPNQDWVECPHLHLYREGDGPGTSKWAFPVPSKHFKNLSDIGETLSNFLDYCNIVKPPNHYYYLGVL